MQVWQRTMFVAPVVVAALLIGHPRQRWAEVRNYFGDTLPRALSDITSAGAGERVLPPPVQAMLALLRGHSVDTYRVSPKIAADPLISQRIVESAWPIRPNRAANWYLAFAAEALPTNCRSLDRREDVVLARCP